MGSSQGHTLSMHPRATVWKCAAATTTALVTLELLAFPAMAQATPSEASAPTSGASTATAPASSPAQYIVSDSTTEGSSAAVAATRLIGGALGASLPAADAVVATLTAAEVSLLEDIPGVTVTPNYPVTMLGTPATLSGAAPAAVFPQQTGATQLWSEGDSGSGVNVAVVDTGIDPLPDFAGRLVGGVDLTGGNNPFDDQYGHGTFVAGLIAGNGASSSGLYEGEAPGAGLVSVKVAGASGQTTLSTVIEGIDWVIANRAVDNIRVMNLSLGYVPQESSVVDPLDQAVEQAWEAGIVVVVAAGNYGPFNGTILSPGDDPFVITVGAINDHGNVSPAGDTMASFSSVGPTNPDGWFKPDLVTSGTSLVSLMAPGSTIADNYPQAQVGNGNFVGSGTSFSSAITTGAVALLLAHNPSLQPDQVKADLLASTMPGPVGNPFVDGHGLLDVAAAAGEPRGLALQQDFGQTYVQLPLPVDLVVAPGAILSAGYTLQMNGAHAAATSSLAGGELSVPVACSLLGAPVGEIQVDIPTESYVIPAGSGAAYPAASTLQGEAVAPNLCSGGLMFAAGLGATAAFSGALISTNTASAEKVTFLSGAGDLLAIPLGNTKVVPISLNDIGTSVNLSTTWAGSSWDSANWKDLEASQSERSATTAAPSGVAWSGSAWNGVAWSGSAWNGVAWSGSAWNGVAWSGSAWNGVAWSGSAWNGVAWSGQQWGAAPAD